MTIDPTVAVVDDEQPVRTMLGRALRLAGYRVAPFACGEDFLASLHALAPSCVVLDVHMPGLSGFDVHARMHAAGTVVPAVFMTASDESALDAAARKLNARLLRKPFAIDDLVSAVDAAIASTGEGT